MARLLANPKYTGRIVLGRTTNTGPSKRTGERKTRRLPRAYWTWADEANAHPALTDMQTWEAAQAIGRERGNVRDPLTPPRKDAQLYPFRGRIRDRQCNRRMHGSARPTRRPGETCVYYVCPVNAANPWHAHDHPAHVRASVREDVFTAALSLFLDQYAFGYDRAAQAAALIPATAAAQHDHNQARAATLRRRHAQAEAAITGLITEIEQLGASTVPADAALRDRIKGRFTQRHNEITAITAELAALDNAPPIADDDLSLLDELPHALGLLAHAPAAVQEIIAAAFDMQCVYRPDSRQATVIVTITDTTPGIINALVTDPRTDHDTAAPAATSGEPSVDMTPAPIGCLTIHAHGVASSRAPRFVPIIA